MLAMKTYLLDLLGNDGILATTESVCLTLGLVTSGVDRLGKVALKAL